MDWITGLQRSIDYIEAHLTDEIDYEEVAKQSFSSSYHFQRVFSILCGYTLGEYIRKRRLTLAGAELQIEKIKVIDAAFKYGYDSPDSFTKAFQKFHGITPSMARVDGAMLKTFSRLTLKITLEGGSTMNYKVEEKSELNMVGYKKHFSGKPANRAEQEEDFYVNTRRLQYTLKGMARDCETSFNVMTNYSDDGYDFYIAAKVEDRILEDLSEALNGDVEPFEGLNIPAGKYLICETARSRYPTVEFEEVRRKAVSEWLPTLGLELAAAPEVAVYHWFYEPENEEYNNSRYAELWIPVC